MADDHLSPFGIEHYLAPPPYRWKGELLIDVELQEKLMAVDRAQAQLDIFNCVARCRSGCRPCDATADVGDSDGQPGSWTGP